MGAAHGVRLWEVQLEALRARLTVQQQLEQQKRMPGALQLPGSEGVRFVLGCALYLLGDSGLYERHVAYPMTTTMLTGVSPGALVDGQALCQPGGTTERTIAPFLEGV
uniref:Uncharacterized protein n=1 Tax=Chlamydomonas leiostraca TaxID=1034604 RepID=A0A7S0WXW6_9CHLO|mmetsp:Transcript_32981/g.83739  ORF Transcript_32981/g.83739 Transcript_32981/m.83739 type:complete len:108 (+) Transcript_32981:468-791(+)